MAANFTTWEGLDTSRGPSGSIWGRAGVLGCIEDPGKGCFFRDDFMSFPITPPTTEGNWGSYAAFSSTGGFMTDDVTELGGAVAMGSNDDNEGASIRTLSTPFKLTPTGNKFFFEARILTSTIADTTFDIFVGLMGNSALTAISPITATGTLADVNLLGFFRPETSRTVAGTGGGIMNIVYKANGVTAVTVLTDAVTLVANTYIKLGMKFEPSGDKDGPHRLSFYVNGVRATTSKQIPDASGTDFPNHVNMGPVFAVLNAAGTSPGSASLDWWQALQHF